MNNVHQAERFVEGMGTFESKADMLSKLDDNRFAGGRRLQDVVSFISSRDNSINTVLVPLLDHLINDETARPLNLKLRNRILMTLFNTPSFLDCLVSLSKSGFLSSAATLTKIGSFLLCLAKAFVEARHSEAIRELAVLYRDKGELPSMWLVYLTSFSSWLTYQLYFINTPIMKVSKRPAFFASF
jgi:hypothetical protein